MATPISPPPATKCHYRSCSVVGPNNPRINCYAPGCDRAFHSYCYDLGVLRKNILGHFDLSNLQAPYLKIACKKECYKKAYRHHMNVSADPEDRNIPWNRDGGEGDDDPNNSENILIAWLKHPGNYAKFRSPPSGKTKVAVCEEISQKIHLAKTLKIRKAPSVQSKIQAMEGAFRDAHDWVNNTGVGVLERDGQVTFEEAVKKRFSYYYDLVDVMSERASARPRASTDTMNMADGDTSSSSSSSSADEDDDDDGAIVAPSPPTATAPTAPTAPTATAPTTRAEDDASEEDDEALFEPTFASPSPIIGTTTTVGTVAGGTSSGGSYSSLTAETTALAVSAVAVSASGEKRKSKNNKKAANKKKAKNNKPKPKPRSTKGSRTSPHEIDDVDDNSWQVSMLDIRHGKVDLEVEEWSSQKEQKSMELQLQQEKWRSESKQQNLEYKFDLMVKYKKLTEQGFDNHQIVKMIPDMRPIIDSANMPVHLQLTPPQEQHDNDTD